MIHVYKYKDLRIQIDSADYDYLNHLKKDFTRYVSGYQFMPKFLSGSWNGKASMFNTMSRSLPYGLLVDFLRFHKKHYPDVPLDIEPDVKNFFKGGNVEIYYDLKFVPWDFQQDCIEAALKHSKGIIRSATGSGKSLMIAYIIKTLLENKKGKKAIIIVPNLSLIEQFKDDLVDYGFDEDSIGKVSSKSKEWDNIIVISTWQTLAKNHDRLNDFDIVIVDEVHGAKAHVLKEILSKITTANYRLGFTGTLHDATLDLWNVKAYLGPVLRDYTSGELAEQGYVAKCNVNVIDINYLQDFEGYYDDVKDAVFQNGFRLRVIFQLVKKLEKKGNILILVGKVKKEGEFLENYIREKDKKGREIVFLSGRDDAKVRNYWRKECDKRKGIILIATYGILQVGVNIPSLKYIIMAAPFKSKIRVLQSIGRALRQHAEKVDGAQIYDITDETKYFADHGIKRLRHYHAESFNISEFFFEEGEKILFQNINT